MISAKGKSALSKWLGVFSDLPDGLSIFGMAMIAVCGAVGAWLVVPQGKMVIELADS